MTDRSSLSRRTLIAMLLGFGFAAALPGAAEARGRRSGGKKAAKRSRRARSGSSPSSGDVYFSSCREAREAGYSRLRRGDPGYSPRLDRDGDGIACE